MHGLVRSVRCRALDFIASRHTSHVVACHDRDTTRRDSTHPTVKLPLAVLPWRRARLCSHLHRVHYNERDAVTTSTAAFTTILSRCGNAWRKIQQHSSALRPWETIMSSWQL